MSTDIQDIEKELIEEFDLYGEDWEGKYGYIIELGKYLPKMDASLKNDTTLIKGCQSNVWLYATKDQNNIIHFTADSDALIPKGVISLLVKIVNNQPADKIRDYDFGIINKIGLKEHLSPTRANGLVSMINKIKTLAN